MPEYRHEADELREILPRHVREDLADLPNVVATGIGPKRVDGRRTDDAALVVFVSEKCPKADLDPDGVIPKQFAINGTAVPTDVQSVGSGFQAMSAHPGAAAPTRTEYLRPFKGGLSIGRFDTPSSSTAQVTNEDGDTFVILTRHAVGLERTYPEGTPVYSPTHADTSQHHLGEVVESSDWAYGTKWNLSDAALVEVTEEHVARDYVGYRVPDSAGRPDLDRRCVQFSAADGNLGGEVLAEDVVTEVNYSFGTLTFEKLIVTDLPGTPGSSGAVVAQRLPEDDDLRIIGQHIAGSSGAGLVQPWTSLEREFDMRFSP